MLDLPAPGTIVAGKYRVISLLGEGGMSAVFRAHHELMDKPVALKWLRPELATRPEAKDRFMREARASARLKHPNVVDVHDVGVHEGAFFLVMELLEGESFAELISRGNISIPNAIRLLLGAMEGVAMAHEQGIVHRDIKPENIFVVRNRVYPDGIAKILDFGISKLTDEGGGRSLTKTGHTVGTPEYMSMEQMTGDPDVDGRADVYSFGVLLYRALTGVSPFSGETFAAIAVKVATSNPVPPRELRPDLPPALEQVVLKAMARSRDHRYPTIRALIDALSFLGSTQGFLSQMPNPAGGPPLLTPTPNALRDPFPFGGDFRAETVQLRTPANATKALTEPSIAPRPVRPSQPERSRAVPLLLGALLLGGIGVGTWQLWPQPQVAGRAGPAELPTRPGGQVTPSDQERPLAQQPQAPSTGEAPPGSGVDDWNPAQPVVVRDTLAEPPTTPTHAADTATPGSGGDALPSGQATPPVNADVAAGRPPRRGRHDRRPSSSSSSETTSSVEVSTPKPAATEAATPSGTKSATGRRSGTLRSDDF